VKPFIDAVLDVVKAVFKVHFKLIKVVLISMYRRRGYRGHVRKAFLAHRRVRLRSASADGRRDTAADRAEANTAANEDIGVMVMVSI
jgi:hypothetical protein